jgi:hypothetical protein
LDILRDGKSQQLSMIAAGLPKSLSGTERLVPRK